MTLSNLIQLANEKANSGKSVNMNAAVKVLSENGFTVTFNKRIGYKDVKPAGQRYVTSRKIVDYFTLTVSKEDKVLFHTDSEIYLHSSYNFTNFISNL